ncbi:hypothetical protein NND09_05610 [Prevotella copri]|uniref:Uncharacterized protein n=1 Tax=Segatella copri TaxID=165179 RepID=A0AAW4YHQ6_9BACT|nr:hypothetical protein [Segatella copri]MCE4121675.1 hypothetical protein [Segatella copri]MCP9498042.1 hypothetical protein [Segatella copri]MCP9512981.1 hypothetical protein [Segatella copri]MCP9521964.1 hypothetical protein [Segatella copri]
MIKPVTMYSVICDRCGKTFIDEFNGIVAWLDEGTAKEQAMESAIYSNDELKILKNLLEKVLCEVNEYIHL